MYEPLRGKKQVSTFHEHLDIETFDSDDIKSAVKFYKKYRYNPSMLQVDKRYIIELFWKHCHQKKEQRMAFEDWFFDYCFQDVIS